MTKKVAIALGGGAPNLTLMTGALSALDEAGVEFEVITTTGAGMVAGLLYAAPRLGPGEDWPAARRRALAATREMGIDDLIYDQFPVNYKIFQKPGKAAEAYAQMVNPAIWGIPRDSRRRRLLGDTLGFMAAMMQPGTLTPDSQGLCQPPPWIEILVDFTQLRRNIDGEKVFRMSAYCIEDQEERAFRKDEITAAHFKAGLAMPFIYAPFKLPEPDGTEKTYLEGSAIRTMQFNPDGVMTEREIDTLIYFDLMGNRHLLAEPKGIVDAWGKSIVAPLTQLAYLQEQLVDLKRFAYDIMYSNLEIITNYDDMTSDIEELIDRDRAAAGRLSPLGAEILDTIAERRRERGRLLDKIKARLMKLGEASATLAAATAEVSPDTDIVEDLLGQDSELAQKQGAMIAALTQSIDKARTRDEVDRLQQRLDNWIRYAGFMFTELERIACFGGERIHPRRPEMLRMPFRDHIRKEHWPHILDWSHSNMSRLYDIGRETAEAFIGRHWRELGLAQAPAAGDA